MEQLANALVVLLLILLVVSLMWGLWKRWESKNGQIVIQKHGPGTWVVSGVQNY